MSKLDIIFNTLLTSIRYTFKQAKFWPRKFHIPGRIQIIKWTSIKTF